MNEEKVITLALEATDGSVLVSSPEFPLLHLELENGSEAEIERCVLPVLKEMVEFKVGAPVALRLAGSFEETGEAKPVRMTPSHVIASRAVSHVG